MLEWTNKYLPNFEVTPPFLHQNKKDHLKKYQTGDINFDNQTITVAVSKAGKISVIEFDLYGSEDNCYFEYGPMLEHINVNDFESIREKYLGV